MLHLRFIFNNMYRLLINQPPAFSLYYIKKAVPNLGCLPGVLTSSSFAGIFSKQPQSNMVNKMWNFIVVIRSCKLGHTG